jgi:hypothetical protein
MAARRWPSGSGWVGAQADLSSPKPSARAPTSRISRGRKASRRWSRLPVTSGPTAWLIAWDRSLKTKATYHGLLFGVFNYALEEGFVTVNPCARTPPKRSRIRQCPCQHPRRWCRPVYADYDPSGACRGASFGGNLLNLSPRLLIDSHGNSSDGWPVEPPCGRRRTGEQLAVGGGGNPRAGSFVS